MTKTKQNTMQAAAIDRFGGIETITLRTLRVPEVGPDEVLIRVESAGVAVWDVFEREGGFAQMFGIEPKFPYVLGSDGAGTIAAVGGKVSSFKAGSLGFPEKGRRRIHDLGYSDWLIGSQPAATVSTTWPAAKR
jgi:NADPH:quinone reductase